MKKTQIAMAAFAAIAVSGAALAQNKTTPMTPSALTLSGTVDVGVTHGSATGTGSADVTAVTSGNASTSKLIFRGVEDLGGGLYAHFHLEGHIFADNGTAGASLTTNNQTAIPSGTGFNFSRRSTVGLMSKTWGELRFGREPTAAAWNIADTDPFLNVGVGIIIPVTSPANGLGAGALYALLPAGQGNAGPFIRVSNAITYLTPDTLGGFYAHGSHFFGENVKNGAANEDDGTGNTLRLGYVKGPFHAAVGYTNVTFKASPTGTAAGSPSGDFRVTNAMFNYNFGVFKLMTAVSRDVRKSPVEAVGKTWSVGGIMPVGVNEFRVAVGRYTIDAGPTTVDPSATKFAVGYVHNLSKRTAFYTTLAQVRNKNGARVALGGAAIGAGLTDAKSTGFDIGIRHHF